MGKIKTTQKELIDPETGEIHKLQTVDKTYTGKHFQKVFWKDFIYSLDVVTNAQTKVALTLVDMKDDRTNMVIATQDEIAQESGVSRQTVSLAINKLMDVDFISKKQNGVYIVNPLKVGKGENWKLENMHGIYIQYQDPKRLKKDKNSNDKK